MARSVSQHRDAEHVGAAIGERLLCGPLEWWPQVFAQVDGQPCTGPSGLDRKNWDPEVRRPNRARVKDARR